MLYLEVTAKDILSKKNVMLLIDASLDYREAEDGVFAYLGESDVIDYIDSQEVISNRYIFLEISNRYFDNEIVSFYK